MIDLHKDYLQDLAKARLEFETWIIKMGLELSKPNSEQNTAWIDEWQRVKQKLDLQLGMCQILLMRDCSDVFCQRS